MPGRLPRSLFHAFCIGPVIAAAIWLPGCSSNKGDFGRPRHLLMQELTSDFVTDVFIGDVVTNLDAEEGHYKGSPFGLTKPEIILRDSAVHFNQSLTKKHIGPGRQLEPTAYAEYLTDSGYTHGPARVGVLHAQIKGDYIWLKRFSKAARQVKTDDGERAYYLATNNLSLTNQDRVRTFSRIKENEQLVYNVFSDLDERIAAYVYVIERTPLETPGVLTGKAQAALEALRKEAAMARVRYDKLARRIARRYALIPGSWRPTLSRGRGTGKRRRRKGRARRYGADHRYGRVGYGKLPPLKSQNVNLPVKKTNWLDESKTKKRSGSTNITKKKSGSQKPMNITPK